MRSPLRLLLPLLALLALLAAAPAGADAKTVWLCRPGLAHNPCTPGLATTVFSTSAKQLAIQHPKAPRTPPIDCFYVYPTVSDQKTTLANFHVDPVERSIALYQAARYSQLCRVYAPMYRQVTLTALLKNGTETPAQLATGINDVRRAFADYLAHDNHGRGFVLIGHSQGSFVLRKLIAKDVDSKPAVRKRLVSAILMGGDVLVRHGKTVGGDFQHVAGCRRTSQIGCVIAFSTYDETPPADSLFGRSADKRFDVLCTNPTALGGGTGIANLITPSQQFYTKSTLYAGILLLGFTYPVAHTTWISEPGAYNASCSSAGGAHVLRISPRGASVTPHPSPTPQWGLHLLDANIALGNLLSDVAAETRAFLHGH